MAYLALDAVFTETLAVTWNLIFLVISNITQTQPVWAQHSLALALQSDGLDCCGVVKHS
jgi:hypothetical protein